MKHGADLGPLMFGNSDLEVRGTCTWPSHKVIKPLNGVGQVINGVKLPGGSYVVPFWL